MRIAETEIYFGVVHDTIKARIIQTPLAYLKVNSLSPSAIAAIKLLLQSWNLKGRFDVGTAYNWCQHSVDPFYLAENNVMFDGVLLKPSMVTPGAEWKESATPEQVADYTLRLFLESWYAPSCLHAAKLY